MVRSGWCVNVSSRVTLMEAFSCSLSWSCVSIRWILRLSRGRVQWEHAALCRDPWIHSMARGNWLFASPPLQHCSLHFVCSTDGTKMIVSVSLPVPLTRSGVHCCPEMNLLSTNCNFTPREPTENPSRLQTPGLFFHRCLKERAV